MITKTRLKEQIEQFPERFSIDELIDRLIFIEKVEHGIMQSDNGEVFSEEEIDKEIKKWFK